MVVAGEELFVCDIMNDRLQVFSLTGEHRRSITGEWKRPAALCFVKDRLYLVEEFDYGKDEEGELINPLRGRRIFVLSLQGETLQVYTHPVEGQLFSDVLCCFDGKLLAPVAEDDTDNGLPGVNPTRGGYHRGLHREVCRGNSVCWGLTFTANFSIVLLQLHASVNAYSYKWCVQ